MTAAVAWVALNVAKGISEYRQGQQQADSLRFQGQMANLQAQERSLSYKREELNATRQANAIMERLQRANAAVTARAAAMNISPFSGSPLNLQLWNTQKAGDEQEIAKSNRELAALGGRNALAMGALQQQEYNSAASAAEDAGMMRMLSSFGSAYMGYSQLGGPPSGGVGFGGGSAGGFNPNATVGFNANAAGTGFRGSMTDTYRWGR